MSAASWLALLNDPESALAEFRQGGHWDEAKAHARDTLKASLGEAYASAKEAGELVARKRASAAQLKEQLTSSSTDEMQAAGGEERLRSQLHLETTLYKGGVATLKELKAEIEALQTKLEHSQHRMQLDFQSWHVAALADARKHADAMAKTAKPPAVAATASTLRLVRNGDTLSTSMDGSMPAGLFVRGGGPPIAAPSATPRQAWGE